MKPNTVLRTKLVVIVLNKVGFRFKLGEKEP